MSDKGALLGVPVNRRCGHVGKVRGRVASCDTVSYRFASLGGEWDGGVVKSVLPREGLR